MGLAAPGARPSLATQRTFIHARTQAGLASRKLSLFQRRCVR